MPHTDSDREGIVIAVLLDGNRRRQTGGLVRSRRLETATRRALASTRHDVAANGCLAHISRRSPATLGIEDRRPRLEVIDDQTIRMGVRAGLPAFRRGPSEEGVTNLWLQPMRAVVLSRGLLAELPEIGVRLSKGTGPKTIPALTIEQLTAITRHLTDAVAELEQPMADLEFARCESPWKS